MFDFKKNNIRNILKNVGWLLAERTLQIGLTMLIGSLIARSFGPDLYGKWQYAISTLFLATTLTYICSSEVIVPKMVRHPSETGSILGTSFFIRATVSALAFTLSQLIVLFLIKDIQVANTLHILLFLLIFSEPFAVITAWFQAKTNIGPIVKIRLAILFIKAASIAAIVYFSFDFKFVAIAWVGEAALTMILLLNLYHRSQGPTWKISYIKVREFIKEGSTYWAGLMLMYIFLRLDRLMLAEYSNFQSLGIYSSAMQISESWYIFAAIISQSIAPKFIYENSNANTLDSDIKKLSLFYIAIAIAGSAILAISAGLIIETVFGKMYVAAGSILQYTAFISILVFMDSLFNTLLLKEQATLWIGAKWLVASVCAFFINYTLIPEIGYHAPIIANAIGYSGATIMSVIYWLRWRKRNLNAHHRQKT